MAIDPATAGFEFAKMALQVWFAYQEQSGKSEAELEAIYQEERKAFYENRPEALPDPA